MSLLGGAAAATAVQNLLGATCHCHPAVLHCSMEQAVEAVNNWNRSGHSGRCIKSRCQRPCTLQQG